MITKFSVEVHENGVVIIPIGLGSGPSKVFDNNHIEEALTEMYCLSYDFKVGDRVEIKRAK